jgi:tRNA 2-thiocytidine biosynthesis protein TtcA
MNGDGKLYFLSKKAGKAIWDYGLIRDGDKVLVAVSGGKDSLTLAKILNERIGYVPINYEVLACHVDMGFPWIDKAKLRDFFERESIPFRFVAPPDAWKGPDEEFSCFWCSWNRRKALFNLAREEGMTKLAFAHHLDDIIETMLLNLFFQGQIGTMRPYQEMFRGELAIIRPLAYVEEKEILGAARALALPVAASACPHADGSKRRLVKGVIADMIKHNRNVKKNIYGSLQRVRKEYLLD